MKNLRQRIRRAVAPIAAAFGVSSLAMATPVQAQNTSNASESTASWQANDDDFLFLQLTIKNYKLTYDVRGYQTDRGVCLDLADVIQALDIPIRLDKKSRRATGWLFAEDQKFTLDRDSNKVQNVNNDGDKRAAPVASDIYDTPEGWCVRVDALSQWFGLTLKPDLYNALVRIESEQDLPFMQAIERRNRAARINKKRKAFDLADYPAQDTEYKNWRTPSVDILASVDYQSGQSDSFGQRVEFFASGEALGASYEARLATDESLSPQSLRFKAYRNDPEGGLLGPLQATQVAAGDVQSIAGQLTSQTSVGRGAFVTNQPIGRVSRFSTTTLRGALPNGWDAELYRNGQLLAYQESNGDGRYEFLDVELFYGRNELEVVLYGPQGQIRRERADYPVGQTNIEPGQTYYWAGILQDDRDLIQIENNNPSSPQKWRAGLGVERGLDERTSAALGAQSLYLSGRRRFYAEGSLTRSFGAMRIELAAAHEWGEGAVTQLNAQGRLGSINYGVEAIWTLGDFASEFVAENLDHKLGFRFDTSLRLGRMVVPIQAQASRSNNRDGSKLTEVVATASVSAGRVAFSAQLDHENRTSGSETSARKSTELRLLANTRLKRLRLRGNAVFELSGEERGFESAKITAEKSLTDRSDIAGEVEYLALTKDTRFSVGYARRFEKFSLRSDVSMSTSGHVGANLSLNFSLGPDPVSGGIRFSETKLARSGQASVTVFRDDNGDGIRNADEELLEDVGVEAGFRTTDALTGENGRAILDQLKPFKPVLIGIDEASLGDPYLAPASKGVVIVPRPGVAAQIELPISSSGEVEGVLIGVNGIEQPGVLVELIDRSGMVASSAISEFDGFFLLEKVPYGEYRLRVGQGAARKLGVDPALESIIKVSREKDIVRLGPTKLKGVKPVIASGGGAGPSSGNSITAIKNGGGAQGP